jgi:anaerobic selenocysteine-containing dehydrogenase
MQAQTWTSDLETGTALSLPQYKKLNPNGKAILKAAHYRASDEMPNEEYPFALSTGRRVHRRFDSPCVQSS